MLSCNNVCLPLYFYYILIVTYLAIHILKTRSCIYIYIYMYIYIYIYIYKQRLTRSFGIKDRALMRFDSYLTDRSQSVHLGGVTTDPRKILCGVPQGSVLGPLLFTLYTADIGLIIKAHELLHHCYADDKQLYLCGRPIECAGMKLHEFCNAWTPYQFGCL